jgi:hypothetical protein
MREPTRSEDATNLSLIAGSAVVAVFLTLGLVAVPFLFSQRNRIQPVVEVQPLVDVKPLVKVTPVAPVAPVVVASYAGNDRLYGTVVDRRGRQYTGYIRWDRNEGSWADQLDATKVADRRRRVTSGIRFGHVESIEVLGRERARLTLKSGDEFVLGSNATDLGTGLRALVIETPGHGAAELEWRELGAIDFMPAPDAVEATEQRIHGTLTTRAGQSFTGYVAWDRDEIYTTDVLDGEHDGYDREIPFGEISAIERHSSSGARVVLQNGEEMILRGTNDVDDSNRGITVSDAGLGQVDVTWDEFAGVRLHPPESPVLYGQFDGGRRIRGTVVTEDGASHSGAIAWDRDESYTWELLDGDSRGVDFSVEFGKISRIAKARRGSVVELNDGRVLELSGSNDVDDGNRGIVVEGDDGSVMIDWDDFVELRLES